MGLGAVPLCYSVRSVQHRLLHHATKEKSGRGRVDPRQGGAHHGGQRGSDDGHEGPAANLFQGHAGGQGAGL